VLIILFIGINKNMKNSYTKFNNETEKLPMLRSPNVLKAMNKHRINHSKTQNKKSMSNTPFSINNNESILGYNLKGEQDEKITNINLRTHLKLCERFSKIIKTHKKDRHSMMSPRILRAKIRNLSKRRDVSQYTNTRENTKYLQNPINQTLCNVKARR
jgi:hypothetical protein